MQESLFQQIASLIHSDPEKADKILAKQNKSNINVQRLFSLCRMKLDKHTDAIPVLRKLIQKENKSEDYLALSASYSKTDDADNAIGILYKLLSIRPHEVSVMLHLADKLWYVEKYDDAIKLLHKYEKYNTCDIWNKLADFSVKLLDLETADIALRNSFGINPSNSAAHLTLADLHNLRGDWKLGLKEQEWRVDNYLEYKTYFAKYPRDKMWTGQPLNGKTLLVYGEQGYGDVIQHYRFIKDIKNAEIIFNCPLALAPILDDYNTISQNASENTTLPSYDYHVLSASLPYLLDIQEISGKSYIKSNKNFGKLDTNKIKVGIVWAGNKLYRSDKSRTIPLDYFNILAKPNVQLYSLQIPSQDGSFYINLSDDIKNFADTANFLSKLDMLISCDTGVAHLAGAIGLKTLLLSPNPPDTRWEQSSTTRWYDSITIIRQKTIGNWKSVFDQINIS